MHVLKQRTIPLGMVGAAVVIIGGVIVSMGGVEAAAGSWAQLALSTGIGVGLMLVALFITARLMGIGFGPVDSAIIKLTAIYLLPSAIQLAILATTGIGFIGWLVSIVLYLVLLGWLFDLELSETLICAVVIFMVNFVAGYVTMMML